MNSISWDDINKLKTDVHGYIRYLIRLDVFKSNRAMGRDLGVCRETIRKIRVKQGEHCRNIGLQH